MGRRRSEEEEKVCKEAVYFIKDLQRQAEREGGGRGGRGEQVSACGRPAGEGGWVREGEMGETIGQGCDGFGV